MSKVPSSLRLILPLLTVYMIGLAVGPRAPAGSEEKYCLITIDWPGPFGLSLNCDSPGWMKYSIVPEQLLDDKASRQSRPGYPFLAHLMVAPVKLLLRAGFGLQVDRMTEFYISFFAYLILDVLVLIFTLALTMRILAITRSDSISFKTISWEDPVLFVMLLLLLNYITKAFLLSPTTQVFNIFVPVFLLFFFVYIIKENYSRGKVWLLSFLAGVGSLIHGTFVLTLPVVFIAITMRAWYRPEPVRWENEAILAGLSVGVFVIPGMLWYLVVFAHSGTFYVWNVKYYGQLVWIPKVLEHDGLLYVVFHLTGSFLFLMIAALKQALPLIVIGLLNLLAGSRKHIPTLDTLKEDKLLWQGATLVAILFPIFFSVVGLAVERIAFTTVAPFILPLAAWTGRVFAPSNPSSRLQNGLAIKLLILAYAVFTVVKDGPYS